MARVTLAGQGRLIENLKEQLARAKVRDFNECTLGELSEALLNRLDIAKMGMQEQIDAKSTQLDLLDRAYDDADNADDRVRELSDG